MNYKILPIIVTALALLCISSFTAISTASNESNMTPQLGLLLSKSSFAVNETLSGRIIFPLKDAIPSDEELTIKIELPMKKTGKTLPITEALTNASIEYTESAELKQASNPENSKTISFTDGGEKSIAVKALVDSTIDSINMNMEGSATNGLTNVRMDVGGDGSIEWFHLGERTGWASSYLKADGFDEVAGEKKKIVNNLTRICQLIDTTFTKDFQIYAKYKRLGTEGNITAAILQIGDSEDSPLPLPDILSCDLPEGDTMEWRSCDIKDAADYGLSGPLLACVFSTNGTNSDGLYEIEQESGATSTAYECTIESDGGICTSLRAGNPFIKIKAGEYPKDFRGSVDFSKWDLGIDSTIVAMNSITQSPPEGVCDDLECVIELKFTANSTGSFTVSGLDLEYSIGSGSPTSVSVFYDLASSSPVLEEIGGKTLPKNETVEIPLEALGIKVPKLVASGANQGLVKVEFMGEQANMSFSVGGAASAPSSAQGMLEETKQALNELSSAAGDTQLVLKILGFDTRIETARTGLAELETDITTDTQADRDRVKAFRETLPQSAVFGSSITDFQLVEPNDITSDIVPSDRKEETYIMQDKVQIKASVLSFSLKTFGGDATKYALVKKEIAGRSSLGKTDIFESISKAAASSRSVITFEEPPTPVKDDPIVKWFESGIASGSKVKKNYVIRTDSDVSIDDVKTIIVAAEEGGEVQDDEAVCGDDVCTLILEDADTCPEDCASKFPWLTVFIIIIIAGILFAYTAFYRGKYSLWNLTKKKKPFTSPKDLESVKEFIRDSRKKNIEDSVIKTRLLEKGWKEEQIKFAFGEMQWEKTEKAADKPTTDLKPMKDYIKTALSRNMSKEKIIANLVSKGWNEEDAIKELGAK